MVKGFEYSGKINVIICIAIAQVILYGYYTRSVYDEMAASRESVQ